MFLVFILIITVINYKIKTSSTIFSHAEHERLNFPHKFQYCQQSILCILYKQKYIYITHKKEQPKINLKDYLQMANLWSHYLSKLAALHSLLILFIWSSSLLVSARLLEKNQCWQRMFKKHQGQKIDVCTRYKTGTVFFVQGCVYYPEMSYFLYFSSKTVMSC